MKVGDLVRVYDPDEERLDGTSFWTIGILTDIASKTPIQSHIEYLLYIARPHERDS